MIAVQKSIDYPWAVAVFCLTSIATAFAVLSWQEDADRDRRSEECRQSCDLMDGDFAAANRYGCFCRDRALGSDVFMLSPGVDVE